MKNQPNSTDTATSTTTTIANNTAVATAASPKPLIPIFTDQYSTPLVDARSLHKKLGATTQFNNWIKRRIEECGFEKNEYKTLSKNGQGGIQIDYHLTLDMAKELAMLERSALGRAFRQYFIAAERELRQVRLYAQVTSMSEVQKQMKPKRINGRMLYPLAEVRRLLGYSTNTRTSGAGTVRACNAGLIVIFDSKAYVADEYVKYMISLTTTRKLRAESKHAQPVLPLNFGVTSNLPTLFQ
jgi:phage anti-repressor protein